MFTLVIGGAASGKSGYAEGLVLLSPHRPRYYIATMEPFGEEGRRRVEKHRRMRADKEFETVECYHTLSSVCLPRRGTVLLECIGNLAANELYSPGGAGSGSGALSAIVDGVDALLAQCADLVVVSNEVFTGGADYAGGTMDYLRLVAGANRALAKRADRVCEVVCGLPRYYKGAAE
jgi:adenosylcobinamide kinase/adenosylcobinamide-phosphate guanylyltransferase